MPRSQLTLWCFWSNLWEQHLIVFCSFQPTNFRSRRGHVSSLVAGLNCHGPHNVHRNFSDTARKNLRLAFQWRKEFTCGKTKMEDAQCIWRNKTTETYTRQNQEWLIHVNVRNCSTWIVFAATYANICSVSVVFVSQWACTQPINMCRILSETETSPETILMCGDGNIPSVLLSSDYHKSVSSNSLESCFEHISWGRHLKIGVEPESRNHLSTLHTWNWKTAAHCRIYSEANEVINLTVNCILGISISVALECAQMKQKLIHSSHECWGGISNEVRGSEQTCDTMP